MGVISKSVTAIPALLLLATGLSGCGGRQGSAPAVPYIDAGTGAVYDTNHARDAGVTSAGEPICGTEQSSPALSGRAACSLELPMAVAPQRADFGKINVILVNTGHPATVFVRVTSAAACGDQRAWYFDEPVAPTKIVLCRAACMYAASDPDSTLQIVLGCDTQCAEDDAGCGTPI
jgi:hypothetical protein